MFFVKTGKNGTNGKNATGVAEAGGSGTAGAIGVQAKSICVNTKEHDSWIKCKSTFTLINCQTVLQSGCMILNSHQKLMKARIAPHP